MNEGKRGPMVERLQKLYVQLVKDDSAKGPRV